MQICFNSFNTSYKKGCYQTSESQSEDFRLLSFLLNLFSDSSRFLNDKPSSVSSLKETKIKIRFFHFPPFFPAVSQSLFLLGGNEYQRSFPIKCHDLKMWQSWRQKAVWRNTLMVIEVVRDTAHFLPEMFLWNPYWLFFHHIRQTEVYNFRLYSSHRPPRRSSNFTCLHIKELTAFHKPQNTEAHDEMGKEKAVRALWLQKRPEEKIFFHEDEFTSATPCPQPLSLAWGWEARGRSRRKYLSQHLTLNVRPLDKQHL